MSTIVTRTGKGSTLTYAELDANFTNLNTDKLESSDVADKLEATDVLGGDGIAVSVDTAGDVTVAVDSTANITPSSVEAPLVFKAKNASGGTIYKGQALYITGVSGDVPTCDLAQADSASTMPAFGLATADANNNAEVFITTFGNLIDVNTSDSNIASTALQVGDQVYVSATEAGKLVRTKPNLNASHLIQNIAKVVRAHTSAGVLKVGGAGRTNDTPNSIDIVGDIETDTSFISTQAPTFTQGDTPIQLTGTQPSQGGYHGHLTVDTGTSRGAYTYSSRTAGANIDRHILFFDLDDNFGARPTGAFQGDHNVWFQANHTSDRVDLFFDGFSTAAVSAYGHGGNSYGLQDLELQGNNLILKGGTTQVATVTSSAMTFNAGKLDMNGQNIDMGGSTLDLEGGSITSTGGSIDFADNTSVTIHSDGTVAFSVENSHETGSGVRISTGTPNTNVHSDGDLLMVRRARSSGYQTIFKARSNGTADSDGFVEISNIDGLTSQDTGTPSDTSSPTGYIELLINGTQRFIPYYT